MIFIIPIAFAILITLFILINLKVAFTFTLLLKVIFILIAPLLPTSTFPAKAFLILRSLVFLHLKVFILNQLIFIVLGEVRAP